MGSEKWSHWQASTYTTIAQANTRACGSGVMRLTFCSSGLAAFIALAAPAVSAEPEAARVASLAPAAESAGPRRLWAGTASDVLGAPSLTAGMSQSSIQRAEILRSVKCRPDKCAA